MTEKVEINYDNFKNLNLSIPTIDKYIKDDYDLTSQELLIIKRDAEKELLNFKKEINKKDTQIATGDDLTKLRKMVDDVLAKKDDNTGVVAATPTSEQNTEVTINQGNNTTTSGQKIIEKKEDKRNENEIKESINKKIDEYIKVADKISKKDLSKITDSIGSALEEKDLKEYHDLLKAFQSNYKYNLVKLKQGANNNNNLIIDLNDNQQIKFLDNKTKLLYIEEQLKIIEEIGLDEVGVFFTVKTWTKDNIGKIIGGLIALGISGLIIYKIYALGQRIISKAKNLLSGGGGKPDEEKGIKENEEGEKKKQKKEKEKQKKADKIKETQELRQAYIEEIKTQVKLAGGLDKEGRLTPQAEKIINNLDELKDSTKLGTMKEYKFIKRVGSIWADEIQITRIKHLPGVKTVAKILPETVLNKPVRTKLPGPSHGKDKIEDLNNQLKAKTGIKDTSNNKFKKEIDDFIKKGEEYFRHREGNLLGLHKKQLFQIYIHELLHDSKTNPTQAEFYRTINSIIDNGTINKNHGNANKPNFEVAPIETPIKVKLSSTNLPPEIDTLKSNLDLIQKDLLSKCELDPSNNKHVQQLGKTDDLRNYNFTGTPSQIEKEFTIKLKNILNLSETKINTLLNKIRIREKLLLQIGEVKYDFLKNDDGYEKVLRIINNIETLEDKIETANQEYKNIRGKSAQAISDKTTKNLEIKKLEAELNNKWTELEGVEIKKGTIYKGVKIGQLNKIKIKGQDIDNILSRILFKFKI